MTLPTPRSLRFSPTTDTDIPIIDSKESFQDVVQKITRYITKVVDTAYTYEQLRTTIGGQSLRPLVVALSDDCHHPAIVAAILAACYRFRVGDSDDQKLFESRALACELVAYNYLTYLSEGELITQLLYDLPAYGKQDEDFLSGLGIFGDVDGQTQHEESPLLGNGARDRRPSALRPPLHATRSIDPSSSSSLLRDGHDQEENIASKMANLNALEIAAVSDAKKFLSQKPVQGIVEAIWHGDIIFWESMSTTAKKSPKLYNKKTADSFSRLRVPKYQKAFQAMFFIAFLVLYYSVLVQRSPRAITGTEIALYIWIAAFAYDEFGELRDAGILFYQSDFWTVWDLAIIIVGVVFFIARTIGLVQDNAEATDVAFDILSMEALFLVPRIFSIASLNPYFGSLLPVLKEMTTTFCKFIPIVLILYLGFLTTFTMLARDRLTLKEVSRMLVSVFFGSSYLGFDFAVQISPIFGYGLMLIFVALTNILLITALVSLVSNSLTEVMAHAREEYLFQYSIYVLESCTSRRLTWFIPPTNLIPLLFVRPLRLILPSETVRGMRVILLRTVSIPFVSLIWFYEGLYRLASRNGRKSALGRGRTRPLFTSTRSQSYGMPRSNDIGMAPALGNTGPPMDAAAPPTNAPIRDVSSSRDGSDLIALVQKLSAQVDELTAIVTAQRVD